MAKGYNRFIKPNSSVLSNSDDQKIVSKKVIQKAAHTNTTTSTNDNLRQSSQKFFKKLCKMSLNSTSVNQEEQKKTDTPNNTPEKIEKNPFDVSNTIPTPSIAQSSLFESQVSVTSSSNVQPKLKGILKNMTENSSDLNSSDNHNDLQASESYSTINNKENGNDLTSENMDSNNPCSTWNSSKPIKQVRFSDNISRRRYKPSKPVSPEVKLSYRQQRKLKKLKRKDSLVSHPIYSTNSSSIDSSKFQEFGFCESSGNDSSDIDD